jgi:hypothetical protein
MSVTKTLVTRIPKMRLDWEVVLLTSPFDSCLPRACCSLHVTCWPGTHWQLPLAIMHAPRPVASPHPDPPSFPAPTPTP